MKNHFLFPYAGNKRQEVEQIHEYLKDKLENVETIIEPFCGSSAMSVYLSMQYPGRFKYILNDFDENLVELYRLMHDEARFKVFVAELNEIVKTIVDKAAYLVAIKQPGLIAWVIKRLIFSIVPGLYRLGYKPRAYDFDNFGIIRFLRTENVQFRHGDGLDVFKKYKDDATCLMLIDPPYLLSDNSKYARGCRGDEIYEYCSDNSIKAMKARIVFVLADNWILRCIFKGCIKETYDKTYQMAKKTKLKHIIISNL